MPDPITIRKILGGGAGGDVEAQPADNLVVEGGADRIVVEGAADNLVTEGE